MAMMDLPTFSDTRVCPKCGHDEIGTDYHKDTHGPLCVLSREVWKPECCKLEHLERWCQRCHYKWAEAVVRSAPLPDYEHEHAMGRA